VGRVFDKAGCGPADQRYVEHVAQPFAYATYDHHHQFNSVAFVGDLRVRRAANMLTRYTPGVDNYRKLPKATEDYRGSLR